MTHPNFVIVVKHKLVEPLTNKNRLKRNVIVFVLPIWEDRNPTAYRKSRTTAASQGHQTKLFFSPRKKSKFFVLQHKLSRRTQSQDTVPNIDNFCP